MKSRFFKTLSAPSLGLAVLVSLCAMPSMFAADTIKADVPFAFQVGSKTLPAGSYEFDIRRDEGSVGVYGNPKVKGADAMAGILTWLAPSPHQSADDAHIVFDIVGDKYILSEVWQPESGGILVHATKEPHKHHVLHVKLHR